jgi:hypothetical protein
MAGSLAQYVSRDEPIAHRRDSVSIAPRGSLHQTRRAMVRDRSFSASYSGHDADH